MAIRDIFKVTRKTFINPAGWIDYDSLKQQNTTIVSVLRDMYTTQPPGLSESFEEAMARQNLTDKDVEEGAAAYRAWAIVFFLMGLATVAYSFYLLIMHRSITMTLLGIAVTGLLFVQAFKYDFWSLQMRRRQLGLTFADWKRHFLGG